MTYPTQPERLTTNAAMTWTADTPTEEGVYLFILDSWLEITGAVEWVELVRVENVNPFGLSVELDRARIAVSSLSGLWARVQLPE